MKYKEISEKTLKLILCFTIGITDPGFMGRGNKDGNYGRRMMDGSSYYGDRRGFMNSRPDYGRG
jgi:hypothetical protein